MLSASAPNDDRVLENFRMFLVLKSLENDYSNSMREYFDRILSSALEVISTPETISSTTDPEAVSLAIKIIRSAELKEILTGIDPAIGPTPSEAARVLERMEEPIAISNQYVDFGETIYATS